MFVWPSFAIFRFRMAFARDYHVRRVAFVFVKPVRAFVAFVHASSVRGSGNLVPTTSPFRETLGTRLLLTCPSYVRAPISCIFLPCAQLAIALFIQPDPKLRKKKFSHTAPREYAFLSCGHLDFESAVIAQSGNRNSILRGYFDALLEPDLCMRIRKLQTKF